MTVHAAPSGQTGVAAGREAIESQIAGSTLLTAFAETAGRSPQTEAFRWQDGGEWRSLTYAELRGQVADLALGLLAIGLQAGDFAVIWSRNRPEPNIADLAVMHGSRADLFQHVGGEGQPVPGRGLRPQAVAADHHPAGPGERAERGE